MSFQFYCPQGHLLEVENEHRGLKSQCPDCGSKFVIPALTEGSDLVKETISTAVEASFSLGKIKETTIPPASLPRDEKAAGSQTATLGNGPSSRNLEGESPAPVRGVSERRKKNVSASKKPKPRKGRIFHIPCPSGHILECSSEMLDKLVICPSCQSQFRLLYKNSQECRKKTRRKNRRFSWSALRLAIGSAMLIGLGYAVVVGLSLSRPQDSTIDSSSQNHRTAENEPIKYSSDEFATPILEPGK